MMKGYCKTHGIRPCFYYMLRNQKIFKTLWPLLLIAAVYALLVRLFGDFRFSDPDQYYHFAVSKHLSLTWDFWTLPAVKGMGWDHYFVDKEFLFHALTAMAYTGFGEAGVLAVVYLSSFGILALMYKITQHMTGRISLGLFAALAPLASETFVLRLMVVRAYVPAVFFLLLMTYFLLRQRRWGVIVAAILYGLCYHVFLIPLMVLVLWGTVSYLYHQNDGLARWGLLGLLLGNIVNPYFPGNILMTFTALRIALDQFVPTGLAFGPEQEPYRSDRLLLVFRYSFLFLALGLSVLWLRFRGSARLKKTNMTFQQKYMFVGLTTTVFMVFLFLSPRFQEYMIPFAGIFAAVSLFYFVKEQLMLRGMIFILLVGSLLIRPFEGIKNTFGLFKLFDDSYLSLVRQLPEAGFVFNCEWWGGHYVMHLREKAQVLDVLDPTLLRNHDQKLFSLIASIRQGQVLDPYYFLKNLLRVDFVLCSDKTQVNKQFLNDPRFQRLDTSRNSHEKVYLYRVRDLEDVTHLNDFEILVGDKWTPHVWSDGAPSKTYISQQKASECLEVRPQSHETQKMTAQNYFVFSGTGALTVYRDKQVYLRPTVLPPEPQWGEVMVPMSSGGNWRFKICPNSHGDLALGVFFLDNHQYNLWCEDDPFTGKALGYGLRQGRCENMRAVK